MDFSKLADEAQSDDTEIEVAIKNRKGEPYTGKDGGPTVLLVIGEYSKRYIKAERAINDKIMKRARRGVDFDSEDVEQTGAEKLACAIVGWRNVEDATGKAIPFSTSNAVALLRNAPWVAPQVQQAHRGHVDFFERSSDS
jgi:hypothetical protein